MLYSLEAFLLLPAQEEFQKYITEADLGLEFQKKNPNLFKVLLLKIFQFVSSFNQGIWYLFSGRGRDY